MKIYDNGKIREMTPEEIKELTNFSPEEKQETIEDRLTKLEKLLENISKLNLSNLKGE